MAAAGASGLYVNPNTGAAQAGLAPFRNALINGDMRINQRGTSTNLASLTAVAEASPGSWVTDRWNTVRNSYVAGGTMAQGVNLTIADLPFAEAGINTFARIGRLAGNASTNTIQCIYNLESQDCYKFIGKTVTLSLYYRTGADFSGTAIRIAIVTGTGIDQSIRTGFTNQVNNFRSGTYNSINWVKASHTVTLPSTLNQIAVWFFHLPTGTAGAADYFDITGVQLELGSVATPFEVRPYPVELAICQRYYEIIQTYGNYSTYILSGFNNLSMVNFGFRVTKRINTYTLEGSPGVNAPSGMTLIFIKQVDAIVPYFSGTATSTTLAYFGVNIQFKIDAEL